jgi:hypothetical protein
MWMMTPIEACAFIVLVIELVVIAILMMGFG